MIHLIQEHSADRSFHTIFCVHFEMSQPSFSDVTSAAALSTAVRHTSGLKELLEQLPVKL